MKRCTKCGETKPLDEFNGDRTHSDGRRSHCKACTSASKRAEYAADPDKVKKRVRAWEVANRERVNEKHRAYAKRNPERIRQIKRESARRRYWADPDVARKKGVYYAKRFRTNNRPAFKAIAFRHRARRRAQELGSKVGRISYERICCRDRMVCHVCKKPVTDRRQLEFDHVIPLAKGGDHVETNIAVSHRKCNRRKSAKVLTLF